MERRQFLQSFAAGAATCLPFAGSIENVDQQLCKLDQVLQRASSESEYWKHIKNSFTLDPEIIHLNCGSIGACPKIIVEALFEFNREIEKNPYGNFWGDGLNLRLDSVRELAAKFIGASKEEVVITRNTTEGLNMITQGLGLKSGDEILTTNHEHPGGIVGWRFLANNPGVKINFVELPAKIEDDDQIIEMIRDKMTARTKVCSFCHIDTITGRVMPIERMSKLAGEQETLLICDGAQGPGMLAVDVKKLGVDVYASSSHKWMLAPKGSGLLYINRKIKDRVRCLPLSAGYGVYNASIGTRDIAKILAHGITMKFHELIGPQKIEKRVRQLKNRLRDKLLQIDGVDCLTPIDDNRSGGIVTVAIDPSVANSFAVAKRLGQSGVYVKPAQSTYAMASDEPLPSKNYNAIRFSTHIFNDEKQLERASRLMVQFLQPSVRKSFRETPSCDFESC